MLAEARGCQPHQAAACHRKIHDGGDGGGGDRDGDGDSDVDDDDGDGDDDKDVVDDDISTGI